MKIAILPVDNKFQPESTKLVYPSYAKDYGVEQDFLVWLQSNPHYITADYDNADWHYLPIFWTRWYYNHNYGKECKEEIQSECDRIIFDEKKTFTICQYAGGVKQNIGSTLQFQSSPFDKTDLMTPELCSGPNRPFFKPHKKFTASFVGKLNTHPIRKEVYNALADRPDVFFFDGNKGVKFYTRTMLKSYISLSPRGKGMGSFRLYESLFLGITPLVIGDFDSRPFRKWINWDEFSFFTSKIEDVKNIIEDNSPEVLIEMGDQAKKVYSEKLDFQKWCQYVWLKLENRV